MTTSENVTPNTGENTAPLELEDANNGPDEPAKVLESVSAQPSESAAKDKNPTPSATLPSATPKSGYLEVPGPSIQITDVDDVINKTAVYNFSKEELEQTLGSKLEDTKSEIGRNFKEYGDNLAKQLLDEVKAQNTTNAAKERQIKTQEKIMRKQGGTMVALREQIDRLCRENQAKENDIRNFINYINFEATSSVPSTEDRIKECRRIAQKLFGDSRAIRVENEGTNGRPQYVAIAFSGWLANPKVKSKSHRSKQEALLDLKERLEKMYYGSQSHHSSGKTNGGKR